MGLWRTTRKRGRHLSIGGETGTFSGAHGWCHQLAYFRPRRTLRRGHGISFVRHGETTQMTTVVTAPQVDQEANPWESQRARFDLAAQKLKLDEGLWRVLR